MVTKKIRKKVVDKRKGFIIMKSTKQKRSDQPRRRKEEQIMKTTKELLTEKVNNLDLTSGEGKELLAQAAKERKEGYESMWGLAAEKISQWMKEEGEEVPTEWDCDKEWDMLHKALTKLLDQVASRDETRAYTYTIVSHIVSQTAAIQAAADIITAINAVEEAGRIITAYREKTDDPTEHLQNRLEEALIQIELLKYKKEPIDPIKWAGDTDPTDAEQEAQNAYIEALMGNQTAKEAWKDAADQFNNLYWDFGEVDDADTADQAACNTPDSSLIQDLADKASELEDCYIEWELAQKNWDEAENDLSEKTYEAAANAAEEFYFETDEEKEAWIIKAQQARKASAKEDAEDELYW